VRPGDRQTTCGEAKEVHETDRQRGKEKKKAVPQGAKKIPLLKWGAGKKKFGRDKDAKLGESVYTPLATSWWTWGVKTVTSGVMGSPGKQRLESDGLVTRGDGSERRTGLPETTASY